MGTFTAVPCPSCNHPMRVSPKILPLLILWLTLFLRLSQPHNQAIFADEGINLYWAQEFAQNHSQNYPLLMDGRFLFGVFLGSVGIFGPAPLYYGRLLIGLCALLGGAASISLGQRLGGWRTAAWAGLLYALLPHALFHERQALTDPLMAVAGAVAIAAIVALTTPRPRQTALLILTASLGLAAAFLFKPSGLVYTFAPPLVMLIWPRTAAAVTKQAAVLVLALAAILGFLWLMAPHLGVDDGRLATQNLGLIHCPPIACQLDPRAQWAEMQATLPDVPSFLATYYGWPLLALAIAAWPLGRARPRTQRLTLFLLTLAAAFLLFFLLAGRYQLVGRYLLPLAVPLVVLAGYGVQKVGERWAGWRGTAVVCLALAFGFSRALLLVAQPTAALLAGFDRHQYVTGSVAGLPFQQAAQAIGDETAAPLILTRHFMRYSLAAFFDPRVGQVQNPWEVTWAAVLERLAQDGAVYLVDEVPPDTAASRTAWVYPYQAGQSAIRVRPIRTGAAEATAALYEFIYAPPVEIAADYTHLANQLNGLPAPAVVATYPPHQLALLQPLLAAHLTPFALEAGSGARPWVVAEVVDGLGTAVPTAERLEVVFLAETGLDPQRQVETWLNQHCFRTAERWVGALRWVSYGCAPPAVAQSWVLDLDFGEGIVLETAELLDATPTAGELVRVRLGWRAEGVVARPYKLFAHLFDANGIVAQYDGQPVGELRPTTSWQVGERIVDQFAIQLPADVRPGMYQLRIGLYDEATQTRLTTAEGAEFWVGGEVRVGE